MVHRTKLVTRELTYLIKKYFDTKIITSTTNPVKRVFYSRKDWNEIPDNIMIERYFGKIKKKGGLNNI